MCPRAILPPEAWSAIEIWSRWRLVKALPFPGGLEAQPCWVAEAIEAAELGVRGPSDLEAPEPPEDEPPPTPELEARGLQGLSPTLQAYFTRKVDNAP